MRGWLALIVVLTTLISGCASKDANLGPTIASLGKKTTQIEPQAKVDFSRQQAIESYDTLLQSTNDEVSSGDEIRRLADLKLEASLDNRLSDAEARVPPGDMKCELMPPLRVVDIVVPTDI